MTSKTRPVRPPSCSLPMPDLRDRRATWAELGQRALRASRRTADGARLTYAAQPGVEDELRELARLEATCCSFADWSVTREGEQVILEVRAEGTGVAALHALLETVS